MTTLQMLAKSIEARADHAARQRWKYRTGKLGQFLRESAISADAARLMIEQIDTEGGEYPGEAPEEFVEITKREIIESITGGGR